MRNRAAIPFGERAAQLGRWAQQAVEPFARGVYEAAVPIARELAGIGRNMIIDDIIRRLQDFRLEQGQAAGGPVAPRAPNPARVPNPPQVPDPTQAQQAQQLNAEAPVPNAPGDVPVPLGETIQLAAVNQPGGLGEQAVADRQIQPEAGTAADQVEPAPPALVDNHHAAVADEAGPANEDPIGGNAANIDGRAPEVNAPIDAGFVAAVREDANNTVQSDPRVQTLAELSANAEFVCYLHYQVTNPGELGRERKIAQTKVTTGGSGTNQSVMCLMDTWLEAQ